MWRAESDVFSLTVTDGTTPSAPATITIEIVDDVPTAVAGAALTVLETAGATAGANLLANDTQGADGATLTHVDFGNGFVAITAGLRLAAGLPSRPRAGRGHLRVLHQWRLDVRPGSQCVSDGSDRQLLVSDHGR